MANQDVGGRVGPVLLAVDAVVDHAHAPGIDRRITREQVARLLAGDGDDRIGRLQRRALAEARDRIAAGELLGLPRPHRLQAVHGRDVRDAVQQLGQVAAEVGVPGMTVDEARALHAGGHGEVDRDRLERGRVRTPAGQALPRPVRTHRRSARRLLPLVPPAVNGEVDEARELAGEVLDVHAGAPVHLGWVLPREQRDLQLASTFSPFPMTTIPPSETTKRSRSDSRSTPICTPSAI